MAFPPLAPRFVPAMLVSTLVLGCYRSHSLSAEEGPAADDAPTRSDSAADGARPRMDGSMGAGSDAGRRADGGPDAEPHDAEPHDAGADGRVGGDSGRDGGLDGGTAEADASAPSTAPFDPNEVYIYGTLEEFVCDRHAIAPVVSPDRPVLGFDCSADHRSFVIDPEDGDALYFHDPPGESTVRAFNCDTCGGWEHGDPYPADPLANDLVVVSDDACPRGWLTAFMLGPDGDMVVRCRARGFRWYQPDGRELPSRFAPKHLGFEGSVWTGPRIFWLDGSEGTEVSGLPSGSVLAVRAVRDPLGFDVAVSRRGGQPGLWRIDAATGSATWRGDYPALPSGVPRVLPGPASAAMDGSGRLYQMARAGRFDLIVRRSLEGESEVVYSEADHPPVKLHISGLFTGP